MTLFENIHNLPSKNDSLRRNYRGVSRLHDDIDRLFDGFFGTVPYAAVRESIMPSLDVTSDDKAYAMHLELPGISPDEVEIKVNDGVLSISGEKKKDIQENVTTHVQERVYGSFTRSLSLPEDADADAISATAKDGILTISIPRKAPEQSKARTITIQKG